MPPKVRELKSILLKEGFTYRQGKGSHTVWEHINMNGNIILSGNDGNDAKPYQERAVRKALRRIKENK